MPRSMSPGPALFGHVARAEFCLMQRDRLLRISVLAGILDGVDPQTLYSNTNSYDGMNELLAAACHSVKVASASP